MPQFFESQVVIRKGTALIGGDFSGNVRGTDTVDIQSARTADTQVASGLQSTTLGYSNTASVSFSSAIGYNNTASGYFSSALGYTNTASDYYSSAIGANNTASGSSSGAIGYGNTADGNYSSAIGANNTASGNYSSAIGWLNTASGNYSSAIGSGSQARIASTTNICGPQINRKDDGESAGVAFESFCGVQVVLMTKEVDLKVATDHTITLPANCRFWWDECGLIATEIDTLTIQPTIRFGITGTLAKQNAAAITTAITAAGKREIEIPLVPEDGETSLTAGVTVVATATTAKGRFYFRGSLVENE